MVVNVDLKYADKKSPQNILTTAAYLTGCQK